MEKQEPKKTKPRKMLSLHRQLKTTMLGLYILLMGAAFTWLFYSVFQYEKDLDNEIQAELVLRMSEIEESIERTVTAAGNLFSSSASLNDLREFSDNTTDLISMREMLSEIEASWTMLGSTSSVMIFYDNYESELYRMGTQLSADEVEYIKSYGKTLIQGAEGSSGKEVFTWGEALFYGIYYKNAGVSVLVFSDLASELEGEIRGVDQFGIVYDGELYILEEVKEPGVTLSSLSKERMLENGNVFYSREGSVYQITLLGWGKRSLWFYISPFHLAIFLILLMSVIPAFLFYRYIQNSLLLPLQKMMQDMYGIQQGQMIEFSQDTRVLEIEEVKKSIQVMTGEILSWKDQAYQEKMERQSAQMQYLQLQLSPHFYLNCLKNANAMLMAHKYENTQDYLIQVSTHLKFLMKDCLQLICVRDELEFTRNYLKMTRCLDQCTISCKEEEKACRIPTLTIQSFVENSIKYATEDLSELKIDIRVEHFDTEEGNFINIIVRDNGKGYPKEMLSILNAQDMQTLEGHFGILNLRRRLDILYEGEGTCFFYNRDGAVSEILLPYRVEGK